MQIIGQETQAVQKDALFAKGTAEHCVNLIDDEHPHLKLSCQHPHALTQIG
jgi:hypothetical protein